jgi:hypothetical protein
MLEMKEAERHHPQVYFSGSSPVEGDTNNRARAHRHAQAWARYKGLVQKYQEGHKGVLLMDNQEE